jgi:lactate permease
MPMYQQNYDPAGNVVVSTLLAAVPILTLLYLIALHPHRDRTGRRHLGIAAPQAAFGGVVAAFLISCLVFHMPAASAVSAFALGTLSGFVGIVWIVVAAMLLYTMTVITGKFEIVKESITHISFDRRLQVLLIAFSFGAIIEGTSGFGTPVAIAGAVMVGLGFSPFQAAVLNLLANTAPVAWGAVGTPIATLASVSGLDAQTLSAMAGNQLPFVSVLVPFWLVITFVRMEGGTWREAFEVWPAALVSGGSFAIVQHFASATALLHLQTDIVAGGVSVIVTALFLRFVWRPKTRFLLRSERERLRQGQGETGTDAGTDAGTDPAAAVAAATPRYKYTVGQTVYAWLPWVILVVCCGLWGYKGWKNFLNGVSMPVFNMPDLHRLVQRMPPVAAVGAKPEDAQFKLTWLSSPGTGVFLAALLTGLVLRLSGNQWRQAVARTASRMKTPVLVIAQVLGLGYLTRFAGTDAVLGLAFTSAGALYPFFAAYLGWLGVFLTGSDTASNALFGSLQKITAQQLHLSPVLIVATNSTGGVMGKMIDAQSIMVAGAACYDVPEERAHAVGPIFRKVWWHSVAGAAVIGLIALLQAYVFKGSIPTLPGG